MRFAWKRKKAGQVSVKQSTTNRLIWITYNAVYWIPIILPFTKVIDYNKGFILFFIVIFMRAAANLYRNNFLTLEQGERFPLRL